VFDGDGESFGSVLIGELSESTIETIAESDDELMMKYLDDESLSDDELNAGIKSGMVSRSIIPIFAASALNNIGTGELLDAITTIFPSPDEVESPSVPEGAQANLIFKTSADPFVGKLSYFRVYGATLGSNAQLWNANRSENERVGQVYSAAGKEASGVDAVMCG
jgi:elongation factor G